MADTPGVGGSKWVKDDWLLAPVDGRSSPYTYVVLIPKLFIMFQRSSVSYVPSLGKLFAVLVAIFRVLGSPILSEPSLVGSFFRSRPIAA